jgi:hypothetical protein
MSGGNRPRRRLLLTVGNKWRINACARGIALQSRDKNGAGVRRPSTFLCLANWPLLRGCNLHYAHWIVHGHFKRVATPSEPETTQPELFVYPCSSGGPAAPARSCGRTLSTLNFAARSCITLNTSARGGGSPLIHRSGLIRATTKERK